MQVELNEEGYTLDGKWKLVPVEPTLEMYANILFDGDVDMAIKKQNVCSEYGYDYKDILRFSPKPDLSGLQSVKGIHVGGEITEEFEKAGKDMWCRHCGSLIGAEPHLPSCPTLKGKL